MMRKTFIGLVLVSGVAIGGGTAVAAREPSPTPQLPGVYRFMIGDVRVSALSDGTVPINLHQLLRGITPGQTDELLASHYLSNPLDASINAYLIETGSRRVLVDTGAGAIFGPGSGGRIPEALRAAGVDPKEIEDVLITHVHTDHSGGLVVNGALLFPNAAIHLGKPDLDYFLDKTNAVKTGYDARYFAEAAATVKPYVDAGKVKPFNERTEILPGIVAELHPGHTPGSAFYTLTSRGERLVFVGDIIHAGAVQLTRPDVTITFDQDPLKARETRLTAFAHFAAEGTLIAAPHLPFPGVGHLRAEGSGYRWLPIEYADRANADAKAQSRLDKLLKPDP